MEWFKRAWRGEEKLWKVFWLYGWLGNIAFGIIKVILGQIAGFAFVYYPIYIIWSVWNLVSQWRCAFNTEWKFWGYVVRGLVLLVPILSMIGFVLGVMVGAHDSVHGAKCRVWIKQEAQKTGIEYNTYFALHQDEYKKCVQDKSSDPVIEKAPPAASAISSSNTESYKQSCEQKMTDVAKQYGVDPAQYIAKNQAYLQQCIQYYQNGTR